MMDSPASMSSGLEATLVSYHSLPENHWTLLKKSEDVSVWRRPSELFSGFLYKTEGTVADEPQRIVDHIRPGPQRLHWDSLMTTLEILDTLEQDCCVVKYTTAGQLWNIISPRQFVDFSYTTSYQSGLLSCGVSIEREPHEPGFVRGFNHPCGWFCVPAEGRSLLTGYIQTDLKGLLPHAAVDKAMANGLIRFYDDLRRALKPHKK